MSCQLKIKKQKYEGCVGTRVTTLAMALPPSQGTSESLGPGWGWRSHLGLNASFSFPPMRFSLLSTKNHGG